MFLSSTFTRSNALSNSPMKSLNRLLNSRLYMSTKILALDFDGVVCASSPESSYSSIIAARSHWKDFNVIENSEEENKIKQAIMDLRPIVEAGYENMLLARLCLQELNNNNNNIDSNELMNQWINTSIKTDLLLECNETSDNLSASSIESIA